MKIRLETARLLLYRLAWLLDSGRPATLDSALVKLYLSESYLRSSLDALQVHGGYGYMTEYELEREVRDAIGSRLYSGTSEIQYGTSLRGASGCEHDPLVHDLLRASAERFPSRTAVVDGERSVTYAELDATANRLAHLLAARRPARATGSASTSTSRSRRWSGSTGS